MNIELKRDELINVKINGVCESISIGKLLERLAVLEAENMVLREEKSRQHQIAGQLYRHAPAFE